MEATMTISSAIINTRIAVVWIAPDGILRIVCKPHKTQATDADVEAINQAIKELSRGGKFPVLADIRNLKTITREARMFPCNNPGIGEVNAVALLVKSPVSRIIGNFFLGFNKLACPTELFTSENDVIN